MPKQYKNNPIEREMLLERTCPVCHRKFFPAPMHAYKIGKNGVPVCSYHCLCEYRRGKTLKKPHRTMVGVIELTPGGDVVARYRSITSCATAHGTAASHIVRYLENGKTWNSSQTRFVYDENRGEAT